jgi:hypothetical protein
MMGEFAKRLEAEIASGDSEPEGATAAATDRPPAAAGQPRDAEPAGENEALDLGNVLAQTPMVRYGGIAAAVGVAAIAVLSVVRGRRRQITFNVNLRR